MEKFSAVKENSNNNLLGRENDNHNHNHTMIEANLPSRTRSIGTLPLASAGGHTHVILYYHKGSL